MSVETLAVVLHHSRATGVDKLVLVGIANHDGDGGAWPTIATLARYANTSERTVQRSIAKLAKMGELVVHRQEGGTANLHPWHRPNRYDVLVACPPTCDRTAKHRLRELPQAPADLWIEGVTPVSPGDTCVTRGGDNPVTRGVTPVSPKPSKNHPDQLPASRTVTVTREGSSPCAVCSLEAEACIARARTSGHTYQPRRRSPGQVLQLARAHYGDDLEAESGEPGE